MSAASRGGVLLVARTEWKGGTLSSPSATPESRSLPGAANERGAVFCSLRGRGGAGRHLLRPRPRGAASAAPPSPEQTPTPPPPRPTGSVVCSLEERALSARLPDSWRPGAPSPGSPPGFTGSRLGLPSRGPTSFKVRKGGRQNPPLEKVSTFGGVPSLRRTCRLFGQLILGGIWALAFSVPLPICQ